MIKTLLWDVDGTLLDFGKAEEYGIRKCFELFSLGEYLGGCSNLQAVEVLPYHTMGVSKYKELGIIYRLEGVPEADKESANRKRQVILQGIRKARGMEENKE